MCREYSRLMSRVKRIQRRTLRFACWVAVVIPVTSLSLGSRGYKSVSKLNITHIHTRLSNIDHRYIYTYDILYKQFMAKKTLSLPTYLLNIILTDPSRILARDIFVHMRCLCKDFICTKRQSKFI